MARRSGRSVRARLADLEHRAGAARDRSRRHVVVYLPRKDGDTRPLGIVSRHGNVLTVLYEPDPLVPPMPELG